MNTASDSRSDSTQSLALPDYNFKSNWFAIGDHQMHYLDEAPEVSSLGSDASGSKPPAIVMVHGNPTWSFYYRRLVNIFRGTHRCIVPDHIGMGLSDKPTDDQYEYSLKNRVDNLDALLESLDLGDNITLVVHDWGGMIGSTWALRHVDRIKKIVVLNTSAFGLPQDKPLPWQIGICRGIFGALLVRGLNGFVKGGVKDCVTRHPMPPEVATGFTYPYNSWANRIAVHRFVQDIPLVPTDRGYDIIKHTEDNLSKFADKPMLICWGMKDFVFDHHFLKGWTDRFPSATVHKFHDAGHYILEDAHEDVVPLVDEFIRA